MDIGIIGSGFMASVHADAWATTEHHVVAVHSDDEQNGRKLAQRRRATFFEDAGELIARVDAVVIATPTDTHLTFIRLAAAAGRQVICEKPLARSYEEARTAMDACASAGVHLLVGHVVRFFPEYATAHREIEEGRIGRPALLRLQRLSAPPWSEWFRDEKRSGGVAFDMMIHDFDYARWITGEVERVYAQGVRVRSGEDGPFDHVQATLTHESGAISHVEGSWAYPRGMFQTSFEISGDRGFIAHDSESTRPLRVIRDEDEADTVKLPHVALVEEPWTTEIRHFARVLSGEVEAIISALDAGRAVAVAEAVRLSVAGGRSVSLAEVIR